MIQKTNWRNVVLLSLTQSLFQTSSILVMTLSGIAGLNLATDKSWATLPIAMISVGTASMMIPASMFIKKYGQRKAFMAGTAVGMLAGILTYYGIVQHSFSIFVIGNMLVGCYQGFAQYYRFAAADSVPEEKRGKAISFVIAGGVVAAIAGPNLAKYTQNIGNIQFAYSYLVITALSIVALAIITTLKLQRPANRTIAESQEQARSLGVIITRKETITALASSAVGYAVMIMVMTATPLAMHACGHSTNDSATVIQWHVLGMFVPSFFTGSLIDRLGVYKVILAGIFIFCLHILFALTGTDFLHFISGLIFLGIGWNFMFIGGSTLLTKAYRAPEKEKTQALHDFLVFAVISISSFAAGSILNHSGWKMVNIAAIPLLVIAFITIVIAQRNDKRTSTALARG